MIGIIIAAVLVAIILLLIFLPIVAYSIFAIIALLLVVVLIIPLGAEVSYVGGEFSLAAKLSFFSYKLLPKKEKKKEEPKEGKEEKTEKPKKEKKASGEKKQKKKLNLNFEEILAIIKKALNGLSKFGKLTVHKFTLHFISAGNDPYAVAMNYNYVNAALSSLAPCCAKAFRVKGDVDVWTDVDFTRDKMLIDAELSITLRLIQLVHVALVAGFGILCVLVKNKWRLHKEKKSAKRTDGNSDEINKKENKTNIQTEERTDSNG